MLVYSVASGALSVGIDVILAGVLPTPGLAYCALENKITGVMVTASHNKAKDNGLKVFHKGLKLTEEQEQLLEDTIDGDVVVSPNSIGRIIEVDLTVKDFYVSFIISNLVETNLKIGLDAAHGALHQIAPKVFKLISPRVVVSGNSPSGLNINEDVGATHIDNIRSIVKTNQLDIGFSFDGDGDRMLVVDNEGILYDGDLIAYIIATYLKSKNKLNKNTVVLTQMSNLGVIKKLKEQGINSIITKVGDKYVLDELYNNGYSLGSENSGHLILPDILKAGDGLLSALFLLKVIKELNKSLKELTKEIKLYPEALVNIKVKDKKIAK